MVWKSSLIVLGLLGIVVPPVSRADEPVRAGEVVVTASRTPEPAEAAASSITVISRKEIEQKQYRTVFDALRDVVGLDAVRSGGPGSLSSVFLRGTKSEHTLVLVDGTRNDPSSAGRGSTSRTSPRRTSRGSRCSAGRRARCTDRTRWEA
jgi:vitamin B12 transporter